MGDMDCDTAARRSGGSMPDMEVLRYGLPLRSRIGMSMADCMSGAHLGGAGLGGRLEHLGASAGLHGRYRGMATATRGAVDFGGVPEGMLGRHLPHQGAQFCEDAAGQPLAG